MNITLKLFAALGDLLPPEARANAVEIEIAEGETVGDVLARHQVPLETCHLILLNGRHQPRERAGRARLAEGDTIAVWPPVAGG